MTVAFYFIAIKALTIIIYVLKFARIIFFSIVPEKTSQDCFLSKQTFDRQKQR